MGKTAKVAIVAVVAVLAFGGAFLLFGGDDNGSSSDDLALDMDDMDMGSGSGASCPVETTADTSYQVAFPSPPRADANSFQVLVTKGGSPVTSATVCIAADMTGMSHAGVSTEGRHLSGGRYEFTGKFAMRGRWEGSVVVAEQGRTAVRVPVTFDVA